MVSRGSPSFNGSFSLGSLVAVPIPDVLLKKGVPRDAWLAALLQCCQESDDPVQQVHDAVDLLLSWGDSAPEPPSPSNVWSRHRSFDSDPSIIIDPSPSNFWSRHRSWESTITVDPSPRASSQASNDWTRYKENCEHAQDIGNDSDMPSSTADNDWTRYMRNRACARDIGNQSEMPPPPADASNSWTRYMRNRERARDMHNAAPNSRQEQPQSPSPPKMSSNQSQDQQRSKVKARAEAEAKAKAKEEAETKAKEEAEAKARAEAEAKAKQEAEAKAKEEAPAFAQAAIDSIHQAMLNKKDAPYGDRKKMVNDWRLRWHPDKRRSDNRRAATTLASQEIANEVIQYINGQKGWLDKGEEPKAPVKKRNIS